MSLYSVTIDQKSCNCLLQFLEVLPVAHKYNLSCVLDDCMAYSKTFKYDSKTVIKVIELATQLQASKAESFQSAIAWTTIAMPSLLFTPVLHHASCTSHYTNMLQT